MTTTLPPFQDSLDAAGAPTTRSPGGAREVRFRHRPHPLAPEREYRVGSRALRWHNADDPGRGAGELPYSRLARLRLQGGGGVYHLVLVPHRGGVLRLGSRSASGWLGQDDRREPYRRFVRALHAAALQAQPGLAVEAAGTAPPPGLAVGVLLALGAAVGLGTLGGTAWALAGSAAVLLGLLAWRQRADRAPAAPVRGALPRSLLP